MIRLDCNVLLTFVDLGLMMHTLHGWKSNQQGIYIFCFKFHNCFIKYLEPLNQMDEKGTLGMYNFINNFELKFIYLDSIPTFQLKSWKA